MFHLSFVFGRINYPAQRVMSSVVRPIVIFVLGGPGAGKGTQCEKIVKVAMKNTSFLKYKQIFNLKLNNWPCKRGNRITSSRLCFQSLIIMRSLILIFGCNIVKAYLFWTNNFVATNWELFISNHSVTRFWIFPLKTIRTFEKFTLSGIYNIIQGFMRHFYMHFFCQKVELLS